jgi:hypothetical protein
MLSPSTSLWQVHERLEIPIHHRLASLLGRVGNGLIAEVSAVFRAACCLMYCLSLDTTIKTSCELPAVSALTTGVWEAL